MTMSDDERRDVTLASTETWRDTVLHIRQERRQRGEKYDPRHRRGQTDGAVQTIAEQET
jgi:hypothetical protein